jgi:YD repeat-containing protein
LLYSYDAADRLVDLHTQVGGATRSRFQYTLDRLGQRTAVTETLGLATRVITYSYDGLQRLNSAGETPGTLYAYAYDDAGNRTGVWVNDTRVLTQTYYAADEVVGDTYDGAGNLLDDGRATYSYDALNRLRLAATISQTQTNTYNGDGVLVAQLANGTPITYTQDLAAPLSQVLQMQQVSTTTDYLYGLGRLAAVSGGTRTWYATDALGACRCECGHS